MRIVKAVSGLVVFLLALFLISSHKPLFAQSSVPPPNPALTLNTVSLNLNASHLDPFEGNQVIRAFIPTGSKSVNCLATFNEILTSDPLTGMTMFCGEREPFAFGGTPGMLVSVFFPQPPPQELQLSITLYQQGARSYGAPVLCTGNQGC
jgi:hypothetical protein